MDRLAIRRRVPGPLKRVGSAVANAVDPLLVARLRQRHDWGFPIPPRALRAHVGEPGAEFFVRGGEIVAGQVADLAARAGRELNACEAIYEFGCGSGRVLTRLQTGDRARRFGSDVDAAAIRWLSVNYPDINVRVNAPRPPASFDDASFDLVYAVSVFTHINEQAQDAWLEEIARLLRPDGIAILSVIGPGLFERFRSGWRPGVTPAQLERMRTIHLERDGMAFVPEEVTRWSRWRFAGVEPSYGLSFHSHSYIQERWPRWLAVKEIVPDSINVGGQTAVLCQPL